MNRIYFFLLIFFSCVLFACTQDEPKNGINDDTIDNSTLPVSVVDDDFIHYIVKIESLSNNKNRVTLTKDIPHQLIPAVGHILIIPQCEVAEFGFAGIVKEINRGENVEIITEQPSLDLLASEFNLSNDNFDVSVFNVEDEDGNTIDYSYENPNSRTSHSLDNIIVKFPFDFKVPESDHITINGDVYVGFNKFSVNFIKEAGKPLVSTFDIEPSIGLNVNSTVGVKLDKKFSKRLGQVRFILKAIIPPGIPVIIPVTFYVYGEIGLSGEITTSFSLNPHYDGKFRISSETGQWKCTKTNDPSNQKSPWLFSSFDVKGDISFGLKSGVIIGLYSASSGIGLNFTPQYSISAEASLSSKDLFKINPIVTNKLSLESEVYCVASFFGKELGKANITFPSATLWEEKLSLLPDIVDFSAQIVNKTVGYISYKRGKHFFLENIAATEGLSLFINDTENHISDYKSDIIRKDDSFLYNEKHIYDLEEKVTYYICPYYEIFGQKFLGEYRAFSTHESGDGQKYQITLLSCDYEKLIPPQTSFILDVTVNADGEFVKINNAKDPNNPSFDKVWTFIDERVVNGNRTDVTTEDIKIRFNEYNGSPSDVICINPNHNHSKNEHGISMEIFYNYHIWYGYNGLHQVYSYFHDDRYMQFFLNANGGTYTPCYGFYYLLSDNSNYDHIYNAYAKIERIE